ncbi:Hypp6389 [Branchiostoma lanceolatum]|uniref:Hypp6389 protein n=1 Tax=Branchiostoma lanceolatum TaxID=7740 RepID=A0A8K0E630_BRALA|nr:Hypp6389 [Branchiostoma lanceolatum]
MHHLLLLSTVLTGILLSPPVKCQASSNPGPFGPWVQTLAVNTAGNDVLVQERRAGFTSGSVEMTNRSRTLHQVETRDKGAMLVTSPVRRSARQLYGAPRVGRTPTPRGTPRVQDLAPIGTGALLHMDGYYHVVSCQMHVACNLGTPNTRCTCENEFNSFGERRCALPKARITHRSQSRWGILSLFCVGVALPPLEDSNYDLQARCSIFGREEVKYRVYVTKEDVGKQNGDAKDTTIRYRACLEPAK